MKKLFSVLLSLGLLFSPLTGHAAYRGEIPGLDYYEPLGSAYTAGGTDVALADGGTGASLIDPNADRIFFWDDSAGSSAFLTAGTGLAITTTSLDLDLTKLGTATWGSGGASYVLTFNTDSTEDVALTFANNSMTINRPLTLSGGSGSSATASASPLTLAVSGSGVIQADDAFVPKTAAALTDGATVAVDARNGNHFTLSAAGNRTILAPSNATAGQRIVLAHTASGADRTLTLTTGSAGAFRFGTDITALTATTSGKTDYIGAVYNSGADRWDVIAYSKGY
jgi:hypothetical protein